MHQGKGCAGSAGGAHQPLQSSGIHPQPQGLEFIDYARRRWSQGSGTTTAYIEPLSPRQNVFAESFNSRLRDEFLNTELLATMAEAHVLANRWRCEYNTPRLHSALLVHPSWRQLKLLLHNYPLSLGLEQ